MKRIAILTLPAIALTLVALCVFSPALLMEESPMTPAGAIVVLGGDPGQRALRAAELYHAGLAPLVIVSGSGRDDESKLITAGVPESAIVSEGESRSTAENALFSGRILRDKGVRRAIIVTTWWHTARALRSFRRFHPDIDFLAAPAFEGKAPGPGIGDTAVILTEYLKTAFYILDARFGIRKSVPLNA